MYWLTERRRSAGLARAQRDLHERWWRALEDLPTIDLAVETAGRPVDRRRIDVDHHALGQYPVALDPHLERWIGDAAARKRCFMYKDHVREIEQIIHHELIVAGDVEIARNRSPTWVGIFVIVGDQVRIGRLLAHPDPDEAVSLQRGKSLGRKLVRHRQVSGNIRAAPVSIEADAVIPALDVVAVDFARRQRRETVRATVA